MSQNGRRQIRTCCVFALLALIVVSCTQAADEKSFLGQIPAPVEDFLDIKLLADTAPRLSDFMLLHVQNRTDDCVVFPADFGILIFARRNGDWVQIPNMEKPASQSNVVMEPSTGLFPDVSVFVYPDYSKLQPIAAAQTIRVVLVGNLCARGTPSQEKVADYIELEIRP